MYMLKSAGKRNQLLVYVDQPFPVAKVWSLHHASPCPVKWIGRQCDPPRISSGRGAMLHWPVVPSIFDRNARMVAIAVRALIFAWVARIAGGSGVG